MSFLKGKWRDIEDKKLLRLKFGENLEVIRRATKIKPIPRGHKHANQRLLNKRFPING